MLTDFQPSRFSLCVALGKQPLTCICFCYDLCLSHTIREVESGSAGGTEHKMRGCFYLRVEHKAFLHAGHSQALFVDRQYNTIQYNTIQYNTTSILLNPLKPEFGGTSTPNG